MANLFPVTSSLSLYLTGETGEGRPVRVPMWSNPESPSVHEFSMEIPLDMDGEELRRLLGLNDPSPTEVIDFSELLSRLPCTIQKYNGFTPRNGRGYVVDSDQYVVHLDIAKQEFWVTER